MKMWKAILLVSATVMITLGAHSQSWSTNGLVAYYPFSGNANDASGNGNHGALMDGVAPTSDQFGNANSAFSFDGTNDYILLPTGLMNNLTQGTFVATIYLNSYSTTGRPIVSAGSSDLTDFMVLVGNTNGQVQSPWVTVSEPQHVSGSHSIPLQTWVQVIFTWDGQYWKQYVNGQLDYQFESQASPRYSTSPVKLGHHAHCCLPIFFDGRMDEVRIYNRALVAPEVEQLNLKSSLVAHYPFSNGSADDASGNGHHGTLTNGVVPVADQFGNANSAFSFDGNGGHIRIPAASINNLGSGSIVAWINLNNNSDGTITAKQNDSVDSSALFTVGYVPHEAGGTPGLLYFHPHNNEPAGVANSVSALSTGTWHQVAITFSASSAQIYIDGKLNISKPGNYSVGNDLDTVNSIGGWIAPPNASHWFSGMIDEVKIYNRSLSEYELRQVYAVESGRPYSTVARAVRLDHQYLLVGTNYQLQVSQDLSSWANFGLPFTATSSLQSQYVDAGNSGAYFRLIAP